MATNRLVITSSIFFGGAVAAVIALSQAALARGGGHHHGECGEHHGGYECFDFGHEAHHHGGHGRYYDDYYRPGYRHRIGYPGYWWDDRRQQPGDGWQPDHR